MEDKLTYKASGVDIEEGERLVRLIGPLAKRTFTKGVVAGIGGFGALFSARFGKLKDPVLVSSTDGVGTKLKVAFMTDVHHTVGIDLVAMCANDVLCSGARPLFFLDYFATGRLDAKRAASVIKGIARGCREAGCALIGGETAEMPDFYGPGEYDLAGFCVGVVDKKQIIDGSAIREGDILLGLASSGLHSNGYTLARKVLFEKLGLEPGSRPKGFRRSIGGELLRPTRIYVKPVLKALRRFRIKGIVHITGGGFTGNIPRVLPKGLKVGIRLGTWPVPRIFRFMEEHGGIARHEMLKTFNYGIGMVLVVSSKDAKTVSGVFNRLNVPSYIIGEVERKKRGEDTVEFSGSIG